MDLESEPRKKRQLLVLLDPYGLEMAIPKELHSDKDATATTAAALGFKLQVPDVGQSIKNFFRTREVGEFVSGALAGAMTKAVLAPLETIRTRMVVGIGSKHITGSFMEIIEENGWQGLWHGNTINMIRIIPTQAIEFATFECVTRTVTAAQEKWKDKAKLQIGHINIDLSFPWISPVAVGGAAAGMVSTLVCHPLEVIKDRLTVNREAYPSITLAFRKICKEDGIGGLYAGLSPTLMGMLPYSTCYYFMYETLKTTYCRSNNKKSLNRAELLIIGALSGFTASTISFPLEVARKRLMVGSLQGKCPPHMAAALSEVIKERGLLGLYRGWGASCLKVMPSSGITWMFYEAWKDILLIEGTGSSKMLKRINKHNDYSNFPVASFVMAALAPSFIHSKQWILLHLRH